MSFDVCPLRDNDYDALADLVNEASVFDGRAQVQAAEEIREDFESTPVRLPVDTLAAWHDERLVGVVYSYHLPSEEREERCYVFGTVRPSHRGQGLGRRLIEWGLARAEALTAFCHLVHQTLVHKDRLAYSFSRILAAAEAAMPLALKVMDLFMARFNPDATMDDGTFARTASTRFTVESASSSRWYANFLPPALKCTTNRSSVLPSGSWIFACSGLRWKPPLPSVSSGSAHFCRLRSAGSLGRRDAALATFMSA